MNETMTKTPAMPDAPPQSARDTWPKTSQERALAKTLVRHDTPKDEPNGARTSERFKPFDDFVRDNVRSFPKNDRGRITWDVVKNSYPAFWRVCQGLWGDDFGVIRGNASGRLRYLGFFHKTTKRKTHHRDNGATSGEHDAIDKWLIKNWDNLPRQKTGGRVSWKQSQIDNPDLWELLHTHWPNWENGSYRNALAKKIGTLGLIWDNNPKAKRRHTRAVMHRPIVHRREELPQVHVEHPDTPLQPVPVQPFRFEACPKCYCPLGLLEKMMGAPFIECPKCHFNILLAEQGITAAFSLPENPQQH
jgi:hypothetical protein